MRAFVRVVFPFAIFALPAAAHAAASAAPASDGGSDAGKPKAYADFVKDATVKPGLIPLVRKNGEVFFVLSKAALDRDFIETSVPTSGLGGFGPAPGEPYVAPARILRFERHDDRVALRWPNTISLVNTNSPQEAGAQASMPSSVIDVQPIVAEDKTSGDIVISAKSFLGDISNFTAAYAAAAKSPAHAYRLDSTRTFFSAEKAFPTNDTLRVTQTWTTEQPDSIDVAPDARLIETDVTYNLIATPDDHYMPRIADPRVGYFEQPLLDFRRDDQNVSRNLYYVSRWNFGTATAGQSTPASHPMVFTLSNTIPMQYRETVKRGLLAWNDAFAKIGISNAVSVVDQPNDPAFDPDDLRNNMVRWVYPAYPQYGAEALIINDPRTGEEINVGINVDAVEGTATRTYRYVVAPARGIPATQADSDKFVQEELIATVLHESGHDMGLQHNFIGSMAYSAKDLQSRAFTDQFGIASSVMEYAPINLWPKGTPQGGYSQIVLGPYDYHAIEYGYAPIPGATTPEQELPALDKIASHWEDPKLRFSSDEDVSFFNGQGIDPRSAQDDLTDRPLDWCDVQMKMSRGLLDTENARFPARGEPWDVARMAFGMALRSYARCADMAAHTIGGEYLSRAQVGDPQSTPPLQPVSRIDSIHAWRQLDSGLFSEAAWHFNPDVLTRLTYSEVSLLGGGGTWAYNPTLEHGVSIAKAAATFQDAALDEMYAPLTLARLDEFPSKYAPGATMSLADLFDWSNASIFGNLRDGSIARAGALRRNLQIRYAQRLAKLWLSPDAGTPSDARALARLRLARVAGDAKAGAANSHLPDIARAQLDALAAIADQALGARAAIMPAPSP